MQVWDIGGQSIAGEMIDKYIYGSHAALIVYDVTNMSSFDNTQDWLNVIRRVTKSQEKRVAQWWPGDPRTIHRLDSTRDQPTGHPAGLLVSSYGESPNAIQLFVQGDYAFGWLSDSIGNERVTSKAVEMNGMDAGATLAVAFSSRLVYC
ncbi:hypothetical protein OSTOST_15097 [Ostertagia ostertagi]